MIAGPEEPLLAELRRILTTIDPVPERVLLTARTAFAWPATTDEVASAPMADDLFRLVCAPGVLDGAPDGWVGTLLEVGELAVLTDDGGLDAITAVAHELDLVTVPLLRLEKTSEEQERTVMSYAATKPLVWIAESFGEEARAWAHERGPMTLLVDSNGPLSEDERRRVDRFVVILGRQAE